ncbi:MAG: hypothetical protein LBH53_01885 [Puniceicoccales bacterium]|jgi:hypothetical protein|nr:hypothetical protein [Puniceicoccales bacterium]
MNGGKVSDVAPSRGGLVTYWQERSAKDPTAVPVNGDYRSAVAKLDFWAYLGLLVAGGFAGNRFVALLKVLFGGWMRTESCLGWWSKTCEKSLAAPADDATQTVPKGAGSSGSSESGGKASVTFSVPLVANSMARLRSDGKLTAHELGNLDEWLDKLCAEVPLGLLGRDRVTWLRENRQTPAANVLFFLRDKSEACRKEPDASTPEKRKEHWKLLHDLQALSIFAQAKLKVSIAETNHAVDVEKLDPQSFTEVKCVDGRKLLFRPMFPSDRPPLHSYLGQELAAHLAATALDRWLTVPDSTAKITGHPEGFDGYPSQMAGRVIPCVLDGVPGFYMPLTFDNFRCVNEFQSSSDRQALAASADFRRMANWAQIVASMVGAVDLQLQDFYFDDGTELVADSVNLAWTNFTSAFSWEKQSGKGVLDALNGGVPTAVCDKIWAAIDGLHKIMAGGALAGDLRNAGLTGEQITQFKAKVAQLYSHFSPECRRIKDEGWYGGSTLETKKFGGKGKPRKRERFEHANWLPLALTGVIKIE